MLRPKSNILVMMNAVIAVISRVVGLRRNGIGRAAERDRTNQLESLYDVAAILAQPLSFEAKAQRIVDAFVSIAEADHCALQHLTSSSIQAPHIS